MALTDQQRRERDKTDLAVWEPMRAAGEQVMRDRRAAEAVKAKEDGVEAAKEDRGRGLRVRV
ncbi:hypothetical protein [Paracraurococcus lichenis]|uniref:Uncharacterized protein n=1 Tax=Paracraurococcus lichenis TaxID=3064888 RepID=A0ABT9E8F0_9PROT|nr:hypothetical protein [Paracraurococcus sp. LOR1-02]MDO9712394.1 hypothetical protein [Paracraurococcus sp. LOR1-02]